MLAPSEDILPDDELDAYAYKLHLAQGWGRRDSGGIGGLTLEQQQKLVDALLASRSITDRPWKAVERGKEQPRDIRAYLRVV